MPIGAPPYPLEAGDLGPLGAPSGTYDGTATGNTRHRPGADGTRQERLGGLIVGKGPQGSGPPGLSRSRLRDRQKGDTLTVEYRAWTDINNASFVPGHQAWQEGFNEAPQYMGGYFAGFRVDVRRQETIHQ